MFSHKIRSKHMLHESYDTREDHELFSQGLTTMLKVGKDFCMETGIHGFSHVAEPRRHWIERLLWLALISSAAWGTFALSRGQWARYNESPTVVTLENDFRAWEYCLPAVTACYSDRFDSIKLPKVIQKYWNVTTNDVSYPYYARFVKVVTSSNVLQLGGFEEFRNNGVLKVDLYQLAVDVMPEMDVNVHFSGKGEINWFPVMTEVGICYSTNSIALNDVAVKKVLSNLTKAYPLRCKYIALSCYMMVEAPEKFDNITVYPHSPYDVMNMAEMGSHLVGGSTITKEMSVMETVCGPGVRELSRSRRGCLYTDEPQGKRRKVFSSIMCRSTCRSRLAVQLCGCRPFYYFFDVLGPPCDPSGMACLSKHSHRLHHPFTSQCNCPPQCISSVFQEVGTTETKWFSSNPTDIKSKGSVKYIIQAPRVRYTRDIVFHFHDLIVSFGGAAGLFLGASVISFVEIFYFVIEKIILAFRKKNKNTNKEMTKVIPYEQHKIMVLNEILRNQGKYMKTEN